MAAPSSTVRLDDLAVLPFCPLDAAGERALETFKHIVIDRPFVLNAERGFDAADGDESARDD